MRLAIAAALGAAVALSACSEGSDGHLSPGAGQAGADSVALGSNAAASCVEAYTLSTLANRAFAFDGTVAEIGTTEELLYIVVVFEVHEWFWPDGPDRVDVLIMPPGSISSEGGPDYAEGTRLLITGKPRWGGDPLDDPLAWYCGFSRTHDAETATSWRDTLR